MAGPFMPARTGICCLCCSNSCCVRPLARTITTGPMSGLICGGHLKGSHAWVLGECWTKCMLVQLDVRCMHLAVICTMCTRPAAAGGVGEGAKQQHATACSPCQHPGARGWQTGCLYLVGAHSYLGLFHDATVCAYLCEHPFGAGGISQHPQRQALNITQLDWPGGLDLHISLSL